MAAWGKAMLFAGGGEIGSTAGKIAGFAGDMVDGLGKFVGIEGSSPLDKLKEFDVEGINTENVTKNANALTAWGKAMAASGGGGLASTIAEGAAALWGGLKNWVGIEGTNPLEKLNEFGATSVNTEGVINNAKALTAWADALKAIPSIDLEDFGKQFGPFVDDVIVPLKKLSEIEIDNNTAQIFAVMQEAQLQASERAAAAASSQQASTNSSNINAPTQINNAGPTIISSEATAVRGTAQAMVTD